MVPISIDVSDIARDFSLDQSQVDDMKSLAVMRVAQGFQIQWKAVAGRELKGAREIYKNSIKIDDRKNGTVAVYLDTYNWLPNALELGFSSFDMKTNFLKSSKVKHTKDGDPYLTIPFRFATSEAIGDNPVFSGKLPSQIESIAKRRSKNSHKPDRAVKLGDIPMEYQIPKSYELRKKIDEIKDMSKIAERTSIYEGVQRTKGGYVNFRRVSINSDPMSWIHPGFEERNFAAKALQEFEPQIGGIIEHTIDDFLDALGL